MLASNNANQQWFPDDKLIARLPLDAQNAPVFKKSDRAHHDQYERASLSGSSRSGLKKARHGTSNLRPGRAAFDGKLYFDAGIHADFRYKSTSKDYRERFTIAAWVYPESEQSGSIITKISDGPAEVENNVLARKVTDCISSMAKSISIWSFAGARIRCALKPKSHCRRASGATSRWSLTG